MTSHHHSATVDIVPQIEKLRQQYHFNGDAAVEAFLVQHPRLVGLLHEAAHRVYDFFPEDATLLLEVADDPEDEEISPTLFAIVSAALTPAELRARLYRFRAEWWRSASQSYIDEVAFTFA